MSERRRWRARLASAALAIVASVLVAGCGSKSGSATGSTSAGAKSTIQPSGDASTDKLAQVLARGTLILFTDPKYPPQSFGVAGAKRPPNTKCAANQLTAPEIRGYDADTSKAVARKMGVEPCFVTPSWTEVTAGNWGDRLDLAFGSGAIAVDRMKVLYMTQPYYTTPNYFFVPKSSTAKTPADLSGKKIGACAGCTMEAYLRGTLDLPGAKFKLAVKNPQIVTFDTEIPGLAATAKGKLDAFLCSEGVGAGAIKDGAALKMIGTPAFNEYESGYVDKESGLSVGPFVARVDQIVEGLHADGTLKRLSIRYFGKDYATKAGQFDLSTIGQTVK
ncbi:MAG: polar amino acid transport system substrate-binding protein [Gaiellales bacterium]|nr:polar amino acid transport system substrate-binding protein [Gaiellales bacterium]